MGYDCGFDMVPALTESETDKGRWLDFIDEIKVVYKDNPVFAIKPSFVEFQVGEHPQLPLEGHKFLRFSSKVSGPRTEAAEPYVRQVYQLARRVFGQQVRFWHELYDRSGHYSWSAVNDSLESYDDLCIGSNILSRTSTDASGINVSSHDSSLIAETTETSPFYVQKSISGKGQGLIAVRKIPKGSRILSENPIFTIPSRGYSYDLLNNLIADRLKQVSKDDQRAFFTLHNNFQDSLAPLLGIAKTNTLPLGSEASEGGLFLQASRINHACLPNCQHTWNANIGEETIHAIREIGKGEEITISYSDTGPYKTRRALIQSTFGFECTCTLCSLSEVERTRSDDRLRQIQYLDVTIGDGAHLMQHPLQHLHKVRSLLLLLEAEKISDSRLPRAYYDAFQTVIAHGDEARAKIFAERAYVTRLCCEGEDSPATLQMELLARTPKGHRLFGMSKMWKQNEKRVPKGLADNEFDKWLWRQNV